MTSGQMFFSGLFIIFLWLILGAIFVIPGWVLLIALLVLFLR